MSNSRTSYLIIGIIFVILASFIGFSAVMSNAPPASMFYIMIALAVVSFSLSYLYPQFAQKDERMRLIIRKGIMTTSVAMLIYLIIFTTALQFNWVEAPAYYLFQVFGALMISTAFISFVVYAKLY